MVRIVPFGAPFAMEVIGSKAHFCTPPLPLSQSVLGSPPPPRLLVQLLITLEEIGRDLRERFSWREQTLSSEIGYTVYRQLFVP